MSQYSQLVPLYSDSYPIKQPPAMQDPFMVDCLLKDFQHYGGWRPNDAPSIHNITARKWDIPSRILGLSNVTECMCRNEWAWLSQDIFKKMNAIRSVTGEKLKRLLKDIFGATPEKRGVYYAIDGYFIIESNNGVVWGYKSNYWSTQFCDCWGEDIASLWSHRNQASYIYAIEYIHSHLLEHEPSGDFSNDNQKSYWVEESTPLHLNLIPPCYNYAPIAIAGASVYGYFNHGVLVGCSCVIPHYNHAPLTVFFRLMQHSLTQRVAWFPIFPEESGLFYNGDFLNTDTQSILFMPDERSAWEGLQAIQSKVGMPTPLACPGGLERLISANVSIVAGKLVHVALQPQHQQDETFLFKLEQKFSKAGAESLTFYSISNSGEIVKLKEVNLALEKHAFAAIPESIVIKPGQAIPGSDVVRKKVLAPIIESGRLVWVYGPEKSGKSYFARVLAHVISYGGKWLGRYQAAAGLKVLYVDSEMEPDDLESSASEKGLGIFDKELAGLSFSNGRQFDVKVAKAHDNPSGTINLLEESWQKHFNSILHGYDVVVLDCYYSLTGGNINSKELLNWINIWKNKGVAFIVVDHTNKEAELQGSLDKKRMADLCIEITPKASQCVEISFPTARHLGGGDTTPFTLRRVFENNLFRFELINIKPDQHPEVSVSDLRIVLAYVWLEIKKNPFCELIKHMSFGKSTLYDWVKILKKRKEDESSLEFAVINEQIKSYNAMSKDELIDEARRLKKQK